MIWSEPEEPWNSNYVREKHENFYRTGLEFTQRRRNDGNMSAIIFFREYLKIIVAVHIT